ncbi:hypothetical protein DSO57_1025987 [Entomophthora muscae]|uniref:Uncharacterized protein n=1 Tax=Entomophthora muscae TaxID=34485 RepID=A0ACC2UMZ2_9FUNG|nr:hypothetical protein DSO57_1025987 [Entomophthora muscae]
MSGCYLLGSSLAKAFRSRTPFVNIISRQVMTDVNSLKKGMVVEYNDKYYAVLSKDHSITGRGSAKIKIELSQLGTQKKRLEVFKPGDTLEGKSLWFHSLN